MILAYEVFSAGAPAKTLKGDSVSQQEREQMFAQMEEVLVEIGFLSSGSPQHIMQTLRGVFGHSELNPRELQILRGILSQISWYVNEGYKLGPEGVRKP
jgi:tRNA/rRNA methyltransferase